MVTEYNFILTGKVQFHDYEHPQKAESCRQNKVSTIKGIVWSEKSVCVDGTQCPLLMFFSLLSFAWVFNSRQK